MKSRSREVNIFNMSLLDILCGALGAFCFMMLVLFPSYETKVRAGGSNSAQLEEELRRTQAELQRARDASAKGQPGNVQQAMEQLKQTENAWHQAEARARQVEGQLQQARAEARQAQEEAQRVSGRLEVAKRPLIVEAMWSNPSDEVTLYVRYLGKNKDGKVAPEFDPNVRQDSTYQGENWFAWSTHEMWLLRDTPDGEYEIYYRLAKKSDLRQPVIVGGVYASEGVIARLPPITFDGSRKGVLVGKLIRAGEKLDFKAGGGQR
jgi:hypothetical protein